MRAARARVSRALRVALVCGSRVASVARARAEQTSHARGARSFPALGGARVTFTEFQLEQLQVTALIQIEGTHEEIARDLMEAGTKKMLGKFGVATKATEPPPSTGALTDFHVRMVVSATKALDLGDKVKVEVHDVVFLERTQDKFGVLRFFNNPPVRAALAEVLSAKISAAVSKKVKAEIEKAGLG